MPPAVENIEPGPLPLGLDSRSPRVRLDFRLIEHDDVSHEDARRFGLERRVGQVLLDA
jgi:hypothetical protein